MTAGLDHWRLGELKPCVVVMPAEAANDGGAIALQASRNAISSGVIERSFMHATAI
jgi:hypothetical protein